MLGPQRPNIILQSLPTLTPLSDFYLLKLLLPTINPSKEAFPKS